MPFCILSKFVSFDEKKIKTASENNSVGYPSSFETGMSQFHTIEDNNYNSYRITGLTLVHADKGLRK